MSEQPGREIFKQIWGYDNFLPLQAEAIQATLQQRDSLVVLPTGGGKSVCYQLPPLIQQNSTVVVCPLISLMKDQVDSLHSLGVTAAALNSSVPSGNQQAILEQWKRERLRLLYLAPERLLTDSMMEMMKRHPPGQIAIDEAHCISSWGHDFRPEYRMLSQLKDLFPSIPIAAYTATATPEVRGDIVRQLNLSEPIVLVGSFHRPNLIYHVRRRAGGYNQICSVMDRYRGQAGIVYAISRSRVEQISDYLNRLGYKTLPYHARLTDQQRSQHQEALEQGDVEAIIATIAFGMGIDKSNIRYVIHAEMPRSIENYQQESGRAGRDGLPSECWLLYSSSDQTTWQRIIQYSSAQQRERSHDCLESVQQFCHSMNCRHRFLVEYFGQAFSGPCTACDVCLGMLARVADPLRIGQMILSCICRCEENFGAEHIAKVLVGSLDTKVRQFRHHRLSTWGLLKEHPRRQVRDWIEQLLSQEYIHRIGEYSVLKVTSTGWELLRGRSTPSLVSTVQSSTAVTSMKIFDSWEGVDRELFEQLRRLRRELAMRSGVAAFIVFSDATLRDLARRRPTCLEVLLSVHGIGERKAADYGNQVLDLIRRWCSERNVESDVQLSSATDQIRRVEQRRKGVNANARAAFPLFDQGMTVQQVAEALGRAESTTLDYLEAYVRHHRITDPSRWVEPSLASRVRIAATYNDTGRLRPLYEALHGQVPYETLRIVLFCMDLQNELR